MPAILMSILHVFLGPLLDNLLSKGLDAYKAHIAGEISKDQLREKLSEIVQTTWADEAKSSNEAVTKTFDSFMQALKTSKVVQAVWAYWVVSQITFMLWLELGVPYFYKYYDLAWPVGSLDQWAYGGILGCLGLGPLVIKHVQPKPPVI